MENDLGNLSFVSNKVAKGKNNMAIKNAKKKGAKMLCPKAKRYPSPMMDITTRVSLTRKGNRIKFIVSKSAV